MPITTFDLDNFLDSIVFIFEFGLFYLFADLAVFHQGAVVKVAGIATPIL